MTHVRPVHLSHVANLAGIAAQSALLTFEVARTVRAPAVDIANAAIRAERRATFAASRRLTDCVPFYFGPRSPMLLSRLEAAAARLGSELAAAGQSSLVYLELAVDRLAGGPVVVADGHPTDGLTQLNDSPDIGVVDLALIQAETFRNTLSDPDRKRRRSAEMLIPQGCPVDLVARVIAYDDEAASEARTGLAGSPVPVEVAADYYFRPEEILPPPDTGPSADAPDDDAGRLLRLAAWYVERGETLTDQELHSLASLLPGFADTESFELSAFGPRSPIAAEAITSLVGRGLLRWGRGGREDTEYLVTVPWPAGEPCPDRAVRVLLDGLRASPFGLELVSAIRWLTGRDRTGPRDVPTVERSVRDQMRNGPWLHRPGQVARAAARVHRFAVAAED